MSSGRKRHLSSSPSQGTRRQRAFRVNNRGEERVAQVQRQPEETNSTVFTFRDVEATDLPALKAPSLPVVLDTISVLLPDDPLIDVERTIRPGISSPPTSISPPAVQASLIDRSHRSAQGAMTQCCLADDPMEWTADFGFLSEPILVPESPTGGAPEERSELPPTSNENQYSTDRPPGLLPSNKPLSDKLGIKETNPRSRRFPYVTMSTREHALYQARGRKSDKSTTP